MMSCCRMIVSLKMRAIDPCHHRIELGRTLPRSWTGSSSSRVDLLRKKIHSAAAAASSLDWHGVVYIMRIDVNHWQHLNHYHTWLNFTPPPPPLTSHQQHSSMTTFANDTEEILVLYGSQTGNSESAAEQIIHAAIPTKLPTQRRQRMESVVLPHD